ncbi:MAG: hypothetical protein P8J79_10675 [Halioglobus sp.]|nr:hypothetical protein [Halioglobus sp.]
MTCLYTRLERESLLHITGPDTLKFLQGQTTCDTRTIEENRSQLGIFCTPQGRVICDFLLCQLGADHFALRMHRSIRASSSAAFGKYIVFSKATLDDTREDWRPYAVWGPNAVTALTLLFGHAPSKHFGAIHGDNYVVVQTDQGGEQFECYLHESFPQDAIGAAIQLATETEWQALQMANGIVRIEAATKEEFVPQTLNYDLTGHISFKKGCYTGQEVVARLHYLGKPKRRTGLAHLAVEGTSNVGTVVYDTQSGKAVGSIVNCCSAHGVTTVLVAATKDALRSGLNVGAADGPVLVERELPYLIDPE